MKIAYSACPNDTFAFDAWVHGKIRSKIQPEPVIADIQQLNAWAYEGKHPVTKVSCFSLGKLAGDYLMLPAGAAICQAGPKIIAREPFLISELAQKRILVPGLDTTAYLLLKTLCPAPKEIGVCPYDQIVSQVLEGEADCGLIIHETRFTFEKAGLVEIGDLGEYFYKNFGCLVPLGVCVAKREVYHDVARALHSSIQFALDNPESSKEYVRTFSQEKDESVIQQHIKTYVTQETLQVSQKGLKAIKTLLTLAIDQNILPPQALNFYDSDLLCHV